METKTRVKTTKIVKKGTGPTRKGATYNPLKKGKMA